MLPDSDKNAFTHSVDMSLNTGGAADDSWSYRPLTIVDENSTHKKNQELVLHGLQPNTHYVLRLYIHAAVEEKRVSLVDGGDDGFSEGETFAVYQGGAQDSIISYRYYSGDKTSFSMKFSALTDDNIELTGFSNEGTEQKRVSNIPAGQAQ